jgi:hypothetical protein
MTVKYIKELTKEELKAVFHANQKLQEEITSDMVDTEHFYAREQLDFFDRSVVDYSIGPGGRNYITVRDAEKFIDGFQEMQKSVPLLPESFDEEIEKALELVEEYNDAEMYSDEYDELGERLEAKAEWLADKAARTFEDRFTDCYREENMLDYFLDFYVEERISKDCYIKDGEYTLYQDVTNSFN